VTDLNIPVVIKWQDQDGVIGEPIPCSSYTAAIKIITRMQGSRLPLDRNNTYWIESEAPELTFKQIFFPSGG
jgi:hypothetical protein